MKGTQIGKVISGVLVGGMLLSGGVALADTNNAPKVTVAQQQNIPTERSQILSNVLDQMVKDGSLTKDKANQVKAFIEKKVKEKKARHKDFKKLSPKERKAQHEKWAGKHEEKGGLFTDLVKNNVLSQKEADALKAKLVETAHQMRGQRVNEGLKTLVAKKTITQAQADKVLVQLKTEQQKRKALFEKIKNMTPEQRQQYFKNNKPSHRNPLQELIKNGTITQYQAKAIAQAIFPHHEHHGHKALKNK